MTKGRYIPMIQREAVFASMMLPEDERNELRARHAMATEVLNRFELHHIQYFAWGAENAWWNLHPMPKAEHRERTRRDIANIAKSKRIVKKQVAHEVARSREIIAAIERCKLPSWPSRPFPKTKRKIAQRKK